MQSVAQGWLMHRLTDSLLMLGLLGAAQFLPVLMFSLWAVVIADRIDKRKMIIVTQTAALVQAAALALAVTLGVVTPSMVLALAFVYGIINAFDLPARQSFVSELVPKSELGNAIALNSAAFNMARIAGPAAAGILLATIGEGGCFWINAVSFIAVLWGLALMKMPPRVAGNPPNGADGADVEVATTGLASIREGIRYANSVPQIRNLLLLLGGVAAFGFQYMVLLPVYARDILQTGPQGYGLLVSAFGLGSLLSAVIMTRQLSRGDLRRNLLIGLFTAAVGMGVFASSRSLPLTAAMGFIAGFGLILYVASTNTLLQITTDDRYRGRVMSLYTVMFIGTAPLGSLTSGSVAERFGAPVATTGSAVVLLLGAGWVFWRLRVLASREAPTPTEQAPVGRSA